MRLATYLAAEDDRPRVGIEAGGSLRPTDEADLISVIASGRRPVPSGPEITSYRLLAPIPRPGKIFGSGINYVSHQEENPEAVMPDEPGFFAKLSSSVVGTDEPVVLGDPEATVDYEVELAIVIGVPGRDISRAEAMSHVFGYTVINDVSDRGVQFRPNQMVLGKGFDTFCPMGPVVVTADEITDPAALTVRSRVNGQVRQESSTDQMLFDVPTLIAHVSRRLTLEPGDLITTGTPAGCGTFRIPPLWLQPGDTVEVEVDRIGILRNPVVAGWR